ncbi:hypothetical protein GCM10019059_34100 [Camelimonas fluminis]|nr:hypothetical protein GCM10019059_34100 [Camelimonas fluminis]
MSEYIGLDVSLKETAGIGASRWQADLAGQMPIGSGIACGGDPQAGTRRREGRV